MSQYDLIVIGSGPAGQRAAIQGPKRKEVALIERREVIGGRVHQYRDNPEQDDARGRAASFRI